MELEPLPSEGALQIDMVVVAVGVVASLWLPPISTADSSCSIALLNWRSIRLSKISN